MAAVAVVNVAEAAPIYVTAVAVVNVAAVAVIEDAVIYLSWFHQRNFKNSVLKS